MRRRRAASARALAQARQRPRVARDQRLGAAARARRARQHLDRGRGAAERPGHADEVAEPRPVAPDERVP